MDRFAIQAEARTAEFRLACVETAAEAIGRLKPGCRIIGLTKGQFSMLDLIRAVLDQIGKSEVILSTWTFGIRDMENARWLIDNGQIGSLRMLTDRSFVARQPAYAARLIELFGDDCVRASNTHCKFAILQNNDWDICIRASMNLNKNKRWENFDLDDNAEICQFFSALVDELESLTVPGVRPSGAEVESIFKAAMEAKSCGDVRLADLTLRERMARLGYDMREIQIREAQGHVDDFLAGHRALEDSYRESVISAALGGNTKAAETLKGWIRRQQKSCH